MEEEVDYVTSAVQNSVDKEQEMTVLLNENGEMILDITQTLSNLGQSQEGSLVIITTDLADEQCNSSVSYNIVSENSTNTCSPTQHVPEYTSCTPIEEICLVSNLLNSQEIQTFVGNDAGYHLSSHEIQDSSTVFVVNNPAPSVDQVLTLTTQPNILRESYSTRVKNRQILPKPPSNGENVAESRNSISKSNNQDGFGKISETLNYEVCLFNESSMIPADGEQSVSKFVCDKCNLSNKPAKFRRFEDLSRHYSRIHRMRLLRHASVQCREISCNFKSWKVDELRKHLQSAHGITMEIHSYNFASMEEFSTWKLNEEKRTGHRFVRSSGNHLTTRRSGCRTALHIYFSCHRSGNQRARVNKTGPETIKKKNTVQESIKINGTCTSSMNVIHDQASGKITCDYCSTHYGHDEKNPTKQHLNKQEKGWILQLLFRGWNSDEIVKTLKSGSISGTTTRMQQVTRQDVFNVCRSHGVANFERRDLDDNLSVKLWIEELREKHSVLLCNVENKFLLTVMNEKQALFAQLHGRISYIADIPLIWERFYRLIAICAVSASEGEAYLLAYAITEEKGLDALQAVLAAIQDKVSFHPELVLSQDPKSIGDSWPAEPENTPVFLTAPWKVEKEWNEGLVNFITCTQKREAVKRTLEMLLGERDSSKFSVFLQLFTGMLSADKNLTDFSRFFTANYAEHAPYWARFHNLPDFSLLQQLNVELELIARRCKALKRIDKCIYSLEYIAANQPFQPMTEFCESPKKHDEDIFQLRHTLIQKLKSLEETIQHTDSLVTLKNIEDAIKQTLQTNKIASPDATNYSS